LIFLILPVILAASAVGERVPIPEGVFYYQPSASVFGLEAVWVNPAGLGHFYPGGFQLMADYKDDKFAENWGSAVCRERLSIAFRKLDNTETDFNEYVFAAGFPMGVKNTVGFSYRHFADGPGIYNNRHFWNIGLISRNFDKLSFSALWSNLNRGKIEGERTSMEQRYGLSYRPYGPKVTVSVDMFLSTENNIKEADYIYHAEYNPYPGLYVNAYVDSDKNFQIGFRTNLLKYFAGSKGGFNKHADHRGTTAFVGATAMKQASIIKEPARRLALGISGSTPENPPRPYWGHKATAFTTLVLGLYRAAADPLISEMVLDLKGLSLGLGQAQELREALKYFRNRGKKITCYLISPNNISYFIASAADRILIPPVCQLNLVGLRAELTFYAGTLEKLGARIDLMRIGDYKTAPERYTQTAATEENREQLNRILDEIYTKFVTGIAEGRNITPDSVRRIIDNGPFTSKEAIEYRLVDGLSYRDELSEKFLSRMPEVSFCRYHKDTLINDDWRTPPVLAVVVAEGDITYSENSLTEYQGGSKATPRLLSRAFKRAMNTPEVKGIVLRINSPGGLALASEDIYRSAQKAADCKPLLISMANVAASGGYYIAMPAERIYANPATITGSIGIYGGKLDLSGLYEKIDVGKELYTRGRYAGMLSNIRPFTDDEREKYFSHMQAFYDHYLELVSANRGLPVDSIDRLARGRVWTGEEARQNGLVDELGGLKTSLDYLAEQEHIKDYEVVIYPEKRPLFILPGGFLFRAIGNIFSTDDKPSGQLAEMLGVSESGEIYARMPYDITIE